MNGRLTELSAENGVLPEERERCIYSVRIAEKTFRINGFYRRNRDFFADYLTDGGAEPDLEIDIPGSELTEGRICSGYVPEIGSRGEKVAISYNYCADENMLLQKKITEKLIDCGTLLIHSAAVAVGEKCYIFLAPSGTGKTTHANNWVRKIPGAYILNGDKPFIQVEKKLVYGSPWCGKEGVNRNTSARLAGIAALERGTENRIERIAFNRMLPVLFQQTYIPDSPEKAVKAYGLLGGLREVPSYRLVCNMLEESAVIAYNGINPGETARNGG